jgi:hypothetical protein
MPIVGRNPVHLVIRRKAPLAASDRSNQLEQ